MSIHVCKQCGSKFEYCRACVFRPIRYKDAGFCSKECFEVSRNVVAPVVEPEIIEEVVVVEEPQHIEEVIEDVSPIEEEVPAEAVVEIEAIVSEEAPIIEAITVVEPTIKKETNTYRKKKKEY